MPSMDSRTARRGATETPSAVQDRLRQGLRLHQQGKLTDAEQIYREILRGEPACFEALHMLGVVALQTRKTRESVELITRALQLNPDVAAAHINLGSALIALTRFAEALPSLD